MTYKRQTFKIVAVGFLVAAASIVAYFVLVPYRALKLSLVGHTTDINCLSFSPKTNILASSCWGGALRIWDLQNRNNDRVLPGTYASRQTLAFAPDGKTLAAIATNGSVYVWEVNTGVQVHSLEADTNGNTYGIAYSPDGRLLATGGANRMVKLWNARTGQSIAILEAEQEEIRALAFSSDSRLLVSRTDIAITIWNMESQKRQATIEERRPYTGRVQIAFLPTGLLLGLNQSRDVSVWDGISGAVTKSFARGLGYRINDLVLCPDGNTLLMGGRDSTIDLGRYSFAAMDMSSGKCLVRRKIREVCAIAISADEKLIATGGRDGKLQIWDFSEFIGRD